MGSKWALNRFSCCIDEQYEGVLEHVVLNLNKEFLYSTDSKTLDHFRDNIEPQSTKETWEILYYSFLYLIERVANQYKKPPKKKEEKDAKKEEGAKGKGGKKGKKKKANPPDVRAQAMDLEDAEASDEGSSSEAEEVNEEEAEEEAADKEEEEPVDETQVEDPLSGKRKLELFLEPVMQFHESGERTVTDYRYWLTICDGGVSINKTWETIVNESIEFNEKLKAGRKRKFQTEPKSYEKWRMINSRAKLAEIVDNRLGGRYATDRMKQVEELDISDPDNPISATKIFSSYFAICRDTSSQACRAQSVWNFEGYLKAKEHAPGYTLSFPLRKFVYKISLSEMNVLDLKSKYMPDHQELVHNQLVKMLPIIIKDDDLSKEFSKLSLSQFFNQRDPEAQTEVPDDEDDIAQDDPFAKKTDKKKKYRPDPSSMTRGQVAASLSEDFGFADLDLANMTPFDRSKTTRSADALIAKLLKVPGAESQITNVYTPIRSRTIRNSLKIREDLTNPEKSRYWKVLKHPRLVARMLYIMNQKMAFIDYMSLCRIGAHLSPTGRKIMEGIQKEQLYTSARQVCEKFDPRLTAFATMEVRRYYEWEHVYLANSSHRVANLADKYSHDSVNMDMSRVHQHLLIYGPEGGEGKSYVLGLLYKDLRIDGTTEMLTYESLRSRATDETNMNDNVVIFDEVELEMMDKSGGSDKERSFKLLLSSNKVSAKLLKIDDEGNRSTKTTYSECITVFFGATNSDPLKSMSSAMKRRWHINYFEERIGYNRSIIDLHLASLILSPEEKAIRERLNKHHHLIQALVFEVEKLIYCGAITDVSTHTAVVILSFISHEMTRAGKPAVNQSMWDRIRILARFNCILDALETTFFTPTSKYAGQPIQVEHLKSLDRKLYCTAEHVVSAIAETTDLILSPSENIIRRATLQLWKTYVVHNKRFAFMQNSQIVEETIEGKAHGDLKSKYAPNFNYARFPFDPRMGLAGLARKISDQIPLLRNPTPAFKFGADAIVNVFNSWMKRQTTSKAYIENPKEKNSPIIDEKSEESVISIAEQKEGVLFIHYGFLTAKNDSTPEEFLESIIRDIFTRKFQLPHHFPWVPEEKRPHIRKILSIPGATPRDMEQGGKIVKDIPIINLPSFVTILDTDIMILGGKRTSYESQMRSVGSLAIMTDLDSWANEQRNQLLYIGVEKVNPASLNDNPMEALEDRIKNQRAEMAKSAIYNPWKAITFSKKPEVEKDVRPCYHAGVDANPETEEPEETIDLDDEEFFVNYKVKEVKKLNKQDEREIRAREHDYDSAIGYFMGTPLNKIFADDSKGLESLSEETIMVMYNRLDEYDESKVTEDYDFDKEDYYIRTEPDGTRLYHWDLLARAEANDISKRREQRSYQVIDEEDLEGLNPEERNAKIRQVTERNIAQYKLTCFHPIMVHLFEDAKYYSQRDPSRWISYPEDMAVTADVSRQERWKRACNVILSDAQLYAKVKELSPSNPEFKKLLQSEFTPGAGYRRRDLTSALNSANNSLMSIVVDQFKNDQKKREVKKTTVGVPILFPASFDNLEDLAEAPCADDEDAGSSEDAMNEEYYYDDNDDDSSLIQRKSMQIDQPEKKSEDLSTHKILPQVLDNTLIIKPLVT